MKAHLLRLHVEGTNVETNLANSSILSIIVLKLHLLICLNFHIILDLNKIKIILFLSESIVVFNPYLSHRFLFEKSQTHFQNIFNCLPLTDFCLGGGGARFFCTIS